MYGDFSKSKCNILSKWENLWLGFSRDLKQTSPPIFPKLGARRPIQNLQRMWLKIEFASVHPHSPQRNTWVEIRVRRRRPLEKGSGHLWHFSLQSSHLHSYPHSAWWKRGPASLISSSKMMGTSRWSLRQLSSRPQELMEYNC